MNGGVVGGRFFVESSFRGSTARGASKVRGSAGEIERGGMGRSQERTSGTRLETRGSPARGAGSN